MNRRELAGTLLEGAVSAVDPYRVTLCAVDRLHREGIDLSDATIFAAGKAAGAMARAAAQRVGAHGMIAGPPGLAINGFEAFECGHPIPNAGSLEAGGRAMSIAKGLGDDDVALVLLSGGASAMLAHPATGIGSDTIVWLTRALMRAGAPISTLNACRAAISGIKGGGLMAACCPARVITLAISDVPTADPRWIGSAPSTAPPAENLATLLAQYFKIGALPGDLRRFLDVPCIEPPPLPPGHIFEVVADNQTAIEAARLCGEGLGLNVKIECGIAEGEARQAGARFAASGRRRMREGGLDVLLWGGETSVTQRGSGSGGRAHEFVVGALEEIGDHFVCAYGTDGVDGNSGGAGAIGCQATLARASHLGIDLGAALLANDTGTALAALASQLPSHPTGTNVADIYMLIR